MCMITDITVNMKVVGLNRMTMTGYLLREGFGIFMGQCPKNQMGHGIKFHNIINKTLALVKARKVYN